MKWIKNRPIAHRGLFDNAAGVPENSLKAFKRAIAGGYPFEMDVRMLPCGTLVVFHDESLERMTGAKESIHETSYKDIRALQLLGTDERIPTFKEMLSIVNGNVPLMIEIKNEGEAGEMESRILGLLGKYTGAYSVHSYNSASMGWFFKNDSRIPRGQVFGRFTEEELLKAEEIGKPQFMVFNTSCLDKEAIEHCRAKGMPVLAFTTKDFKNHEQALILCDNVIFEGYLPLIQRDIVPIVSLGIQRKRVKI